MFASFPLILLIPVFVTGAAAVWLAGIQLSNTTDLIDARFGLGEALGGLVLLAIATNLPEIAIVVSASLTRNIGIAIGNILGGIAIQTVVLVILDGFGLRRKGALTYEAASLQLVLEGVLVISVLVISIMGTQLPPSLIFLHLTPGDLLIAALWLIGLWLINKARKDLPWQEKGRAPDTSRPTKSRRQEKTETWSTAHSLVVFALAALVTLADGVVLEESGSAIADRVGLSGVLFGSTVLAAATALPEVSTGLASVNIGDYQLAVSDIFGGNAFLPVLFLPATLLSGQSVLPQAKKYGYLPRQPGCALDSRLHLRPHLPPQTPVPRPGHRLVGGTSLVSRWRRRIVHHCGRREIRAGDASFLFLPVRGARRSNSHCVWEDLDLNPLGSWCIIVRHGQDRNYKSLPFETYDRWYHYIYRVLNLMGAVQYSVYDLLGKQIETHCSLFKMTAKLTAKPRETIDNSRHQWTKEQKANNAKPLNKPINKNGVIHKTAVV